MRASGISRTLIGAIGTLRRCSEGGASRSIRSSSKTCSAATTMKVAPR